MSIDDSKRRAYEFLQERDQLDASELTCTERTITVAVLRNILLEPVSTLWAEILTCESHVSRLEGYRSRNRAMESDLREWQKRLRLARDELRKALV